MESERAIEKLLRSAAKQRRQQGAGTSFTMHPATRRLLQAEVARQFLPGKSSAGKWSWIALLWPRVAAAAAMLALMGLAVWMFIPEKDPGARFDLAQAPPRAQPAPVRELPALASQPAASQPAAAESSAHEWKLGEPVAPARGVASKQDEFGAERFRRQASRSAEDRSSDTDSLALSGGAARQVAPASPAAVPTEAPAAEEKRLLRSVVKSEERTDPLYASNAAGEAQSRFFARDTESRQEGAVPAPGAVAGAAGAYAGRQTSQLAAGFTVTNEFTKSVPASEAPLLGVKAFANNQQFTRAARSDAQTAAGRTARPESAVLASFEVEQTGRELRIIDKDGSVYAGNLEITALANQEKAAVPLQDAMVEKEQAGTRAYGLALPKGTVAEEQVSTQQFLSFRVAGTNRTLGQNVVFFGNFSQPVPPSVGDELTNATQVQKGGLEKSKVANSLPQALSSPIQGKAVLQDGKELDIEAIPNKQ